MKAIRPEYDLITCIFRLESLPGGERIRLLVRLRELAAPGGWLIVAFVNARSYHSALSRVRGIIGHKGVEYSLAPDPHLGPFGPLTPEAGGTPLSRERMETGGQKPPVCSPT